jgi:hypothetical protein
MLLAALFAAPLLSAPAVAQDDLTPQAATSQLSAVLSLVSGGLIGAPDNPPQVTRDGDNWHVRIPLPALPSPPDAAINAVARPAGGGVWDITALTFPSAGTIAMPAPANGGAPASIAFTIGQQAIHGRIDPSLAQPSPFSGEWQTITMRSEAGDQHTDQTIARQTMEGTITGEADNRMSLRAQGTGTGWKVSVRGKDGVTRGSDIRSLATSLEIEGLDRAQSERLRAAVRAFATGLQPNTAGGKPPDLTPFQRDQLRAMVDASVGLLSSVSMEETLEGIHFSAANGNDGDIGRVRIGLGGESRAEHLDAHMDMAMHDLAVASVPPDLVMFMPSLVEVRPAVSGVRTAAFVKLLRDASMNSTTPAALQAEAIAMLSEPGARLGIESLSIVAGPLKLEGTARLKPSASGAAGFEAHLIAHGVDAMMAAAQSNPQAAQIMPMVFLAKGMARPEGDALVWDIGFGDGVFTINGVPFGGQPKGAGPKRP